MQRRRRTPLTHEDVGSFRHPRARSTTQFGAAQTYRRDELATRRLRLISDIMEDYQENMRRMMRLLEMELALMEMPDEQTINRANERTHYASEYARVGRTMTPNQQRPRYDPSHSNLRTNLRTPPLPTPIQRFRHFNYQDPELPRGYTDAEISVVTETLPYTESMGEIRCPITWDTITEGQDVVRLRGCSHMFSNTAIREWFQRNRRCPVCRALPYSQLENRDDEQENRDQSNNSAFTFETTMFLDSSGNSISQYANLPLFQYALETPAIRDAMTALTYEDESSPVNVGSLRDPTRLRRSGLAPPSGIETSQPTTTPTQISPMNSLLEGIVGAITDAIAENAETNADYFEREFTINLNDILGAANLRPSNRNQ